MAPQDAPQRKAYPAHYHGLGKLIVLHLALYLLGVEFGRGCILFA